MTILGKVVGNSRADNVAAAPWQFGFNLTKSDVPLNNLNALHTHKAPEVFICFSGEFEIKVGGGATVRLYQGDFLVVPAGVERSFECTQTAVWCSELQASAGNMVTLIPGESWVQWCHSTIKSARQHGARCNDFGTLLNDSPTQKHFNVACGGPRSLHEIVATVSISQGQLESLVHRAKDSPHALIPFSNGEMHVNVQTESDRPIHLSHIEDAIVLVLVGEASIVGADGVRAASVTCDGCYLSPHGHACTICPDDDQAMVLVVRSTNTPWEELLRMPTEESTLTTPSRL